MIHATAVVHPEAYVSDLANVGPHVVIEEGTTVEAYVTIFAGAYIGKQPKVAGIVANTPRAGGKTLIRKGSVIGANAVIYAGTTIGDSVLIGDGATVREWCNIGDQSIIGNNSTLQNDVTTGKRVRVVDLSHITAHVLIEDDVFWSVGVLSMNDNSMAHGGELQPPRVERGAMVGGGALLLPGVVVGPEATIGAGSVVTKSVRPGAKVMGVPARERQVETDQQIWERYYFGDFYPEELPPRPYDDEDLE